MTLPLQPQPPYQQPYQQPYPPPPPPPQRGMSTGLLLLLVIGIPLLVLALIIGGSIAAANALRGSPVSDSVDADAGSSLIINAPNASIRLSVGDDDAIHARMRGSSTGKEPSLDATTTGETTEIRGGCPSGWFLFNRCQVQIHVTVPANLDVTVAGQNGAIRADGLTGDLDFTTTNGSLEVDGSRGILTLHSTNGRIEVEDSASTEVRAQTTNGAVGLAFSEAPTEVTATSTNGGIRIEVPDDGEEYFIEADTTNGGVDTEDVPGDRRADRTITAQTTNGGITIETSHR